MTRKDLVNSKNALFQRQSQRDDLLDGTKTSDNLIGLLSHLVDKGHIILFTAIKTDHHDDSGLGLHCHFNGYCADVWFQASLSLTDYLDADSHPFCQALKDASEYLHLHNIGLGGEADIQRCRNAAGPTVFTDSGSDHVHLSVA